MREVTRYEGLDERLKLAVYKRDGHRCRWCGTTNRRVDVHHIRYRRGYADDVIENLISLCRSHHEFVHGSPNGAGQTIVKSVAQEVLYWLTDHPGTTGSSRWRSLKRQWVLEGRCEKHGTEKDICLDCRRANAAACVECGDDDPADGFEHCTDCLERLVP